MEPLIVGPPVYETRPISNVLSWLSCPDCPVTVFLSYLSCHFRSCSGCPVLSLSLQYLLSWLYHLECLLRLSCPVSCPGCPVLVVLSQLSCPSYLVPAVSWDLLNFVAFFSIILVNFDSLSNFILFTKTWWIFSIAQQLYGTGC